MAVLAHGYRLERDVAAGAGQHLLQGDLDLRGDVRAAGRAAAAEPEEVAEHRVAAAEEGGQHVLEAPEALGSRRPAAGAEAIVPERVVRATALGVG